MLDAPVSVGEPKAIDGTMSVMGDADHSSLVQYYEKMAKVKVKR